MGWILRQTPASHTCPKPDGERTNGDLWRCDDCGLLWSVAGGEWGWPNRRDRFRAWCNEFVARHWDGEPI